MFFYIFVPLKNMYEIKLVYIWQSIDCRKSFFVVFIDAERLYIGLDN